MTTSLETLLAELQEAVAAMPAGSAHRASGVAA